MLKTSNSNHYNVNKSNLLITQGLQHSYSCTETGRGIQQLRPWRPCEISRTSSRTNFAVGRIWHDRLCCTIHAVSKIPILSLISIVNNVQNTMYLYLFYFFCCLPYLVSQCDVLIVDGSIAYLIIRDKFQYIRNIKPFPQLSLSCACAHRD